MTAMPIEPNRGPDPTEVGWDLTAAAVRAGAAYEVRSTFQALSLPPSPGQTEVIDLWEAMTGLSGDDAHTLALRVVGGHDHCIARVVPF
jgi:hypothetical protein